MGEIKKGQVLSISARCEEGKNWQAVFQKKKKLIF